MTLTPKPPTPPLEFYDPEPITFQLTFDQLRQLSDALPRLVESGEQPGLA